MHQRLTHWIHAYGTTYGAWLRGDERGWRARHHREHCTGEPTEVERAAWRLKRERSARLMESIGGTEVRLSPIARRIVMREFESAFARHGVVAWVMCVDDHHFHILARFPTTESPRPTDSDPWASSRDRSVRNLNLSCARHFVGVAKRKSARALLDAGLVAPGGVWGKRCGIVGVRSYEHLAEVDR